MNFVGKYRFVILLSLVLALLYGYFFVNRAHVEITVKTPAVTFFKIYWAGPGELYSEKNMSRVRIRPGQEKYNFFIADLRKVENLRIDPSERPGTLTLEKLVISQPGLPTLRFAEPDDFSRLTPLGDVQETSRTRDGWEIKASGHDPRFQLKLSHPPRSLNWSGVIFRFLLLLVPFLLLLKGLQPLWTDYAFTAYFGIFVLGLILTMAVVSRPDHHPDEKVHLAAARYYETNWLPPPVESPEIRDTYSCYGISRLNNMEVGYFFAGKFGQLLQLFHLDSTLALRLFNVTLFGLLAFLALGSPPFRLLFLPLLLSPQIWYIFSYMNSDAFSLFVVVLAAWQLAVEDSAFNRFLEQQKVPLLKILGLGILFALLLLIKKNFYFFTLFAGIFFLWRLVFFPQPEWKTVLRRLLVIGGIGLLLIGGRLGVDYSVNGFAKGEKVRAMQELMARPAFKPSTELNKKHSTLQMRERGTSFDEFIKLHRWGEKSFRTAFGAYGYFTVLGPDLYYDLVRYVGLAALACMAFFIFLRSGLPGITLFFSAILCSFLLIAAACYHSWTVDFQAQGRYLLGIAPMIGMVLFATQKVYNQNLLRVMSCAMFLLSVYSFVFVGLYGISKFGWG